MTTLYLDYCASTPLYPQVARKLIETTNEIYANPSSIHKMGFHATELVEVSKERIASLLQVKPTEVIFTSGATESNNLAILGVIKALRKKTDQTLHVIVTEIEHSSIYNLCNHITDENIEVTFIPVDKYGIVNIEEVKKAIRDNTVLVSIMHVNNETGSIQPVAEIGTYLKKKSTLYIFPCRWSTGIWEGSFRVKKY